MGGAPCVKCFCVFMNTVTLFLWWNYFIRGSLSLLFLIFTLAWLCFLFFSFSHLPIRTIGCNLKSPGVAREAQLLVTVDRGGVRSVRIFKAKLCKVIKGTNYPFVRVKRYLPYDSKKKEVVPHPRGAPERPEPKVFGLGGFVGANVEWKKTVRPIFKGRNDVTVRCSKCWWERHRCRPSVSRCPVR